jgi:hypothetical protein
MGFFYNKPVIVAFDEDLPKGHVRTKSDLTYVDDDGVEWHAPAGTVTDGGSIPRIFWVFIGQPLSPEYIEPATLHDFHCKERIRPSKAVHKAFANMLKDSPDIPTWKRKAMAFAVRVAGPKWELQS